MRTPQASGQSCGHAAWTTLLGITGMMTRGGTRFNLRPLIPFCSIPACTLTAATNGCVLVGTPPLSRRSTLAHSPAFLRRALVAALVVICALPVFAGSTNTVIGINVVLNTAPSDAILADLGQHGKVRDVIREIRAVTIQAPAGELAAIRAESYVARAGPDQTRDIGPTNPLPVSNFSAGLSTWDLDAVNVTNPGFNNRTTTYDGTGVYVAVLDTG